MKSTDVIDLSQEPLQTLPGHDRLSSLPPELLSHVLDYLYPAHIPDRILFADTKLKSRSHPFDILAATSHTLREAVNAWAHSFLLRHASITKYKGKSGLASGSKIINTSDLLHGRQGVLSWSGKHCVFCGKNSVRRAILANGLRCCASCDRKEWPGKITKSQALPAYRLKDTDLFPPSMNRGRGPRTAAPGLVYGIYSCQGGLAMMILEESLHSIARKVHGDDWKSEKEKRMAKAVQKVVEDDIASESDTNWSETIWTKKGGLQVRPE